MRILVLASDPTAPVSRIPTLLALLDPQEVCAVIGDPAFDAVCAWGDSARRDVRCFSVPPGEGLRTARRRAVAEEKPDLVMFFESRAQGDALVLTQDISAFVTALGIPFTSVTGYPGRLR